MKALAGRRVVITRAAEQADTTAELVASFGAIPIVVPLIQMVDEPEGVAALAALDLQTVDWVVVTSPNGARRVAPRLSAESARPLVAAVGTATARELPRCDLNANTQSAAGLLDRFPSGSGRIVVVQALDAAPEMVEGLREKGWDVSVIKPFRTVTSTPSSDEQRAALDADAVLFASGSAARAWVEVFGRRAPTIIVAIGDQTATVAEQLGLKVTVVSADHSLYGMLVALDGYLCDCN